MKLKANLFPDMRPCGAAIFCAVKDSSIIEKTRKTPADHIHLRVYHLEPNMHHSF